MEGRGRDGRKEEKDDRRQERIKEQRDKGSEHTIHVHVHMYTYMYSTCTVHVCLFSQWYML